ncbi:MAG: sulfotransferase domain-containing protein [Anaerolineae bacterium]|nr:sulfotransferase domain-containing protein [Anaerolineae bacterium]
MISVIKDQAKLLRRGLRRRRQRARFPQLSQDSLPVLFANSFPKSGTHLLTQVLAAFSRLGPVVDSGLPPILTFDGPTGQPRPLPRILRQLHRLQPGDVAYGHLHALPEVVAALCRPGVAPFFIYRDPRDVVVSHVFYVTEIAKNHVHHQHYRQLKDFDQRLFASILGLPQSAVPFPDIRDRFEPYLPWLEAPDTLSLRFEDFISSPDETLGRIFDHALQRGFVSSIPRQQAIQTLAASIDPRRSPTFRSGQTGGWRQHFTPAHTQLFKDLTGDMLLRLGYEQDNAW